MTHSSEAGSLAAQLQEAMLQLQALGLKVASLEARLQAREGSAAPTASSLEFLDRHHRLHLPQPGPGDRLAARGSAADLLQGLPAQPAGAGDSAPSAAAAAQQLRLPEQPEVPMAATRMVMAQIVSPGDSLGLDICNVRRLLLLGFCCWAAGLCRALHRLKRLPRGWLLWLPRYIPALNAAFPMRCRPAGRHGAELDRHLRRPRRQDVCARALRHGFGGRRPLPAPLPRAPAGLDFAHGCAAAGMAAGCRRSRGAACRREARCGCRAVRPRPEPRLLSSLSGKTIVQVGSVVIIAAMVNRTFRSSMEVGPSGAAGCRAAGVPPPAPAACRCSQRMHACWAAGPHAPTGPEGHETHRLACVPCRWACEWRRRTLAPGRATTAAGTHTFLG